MPKVSGYSSTQVSVRKKLDIHPCNHDAIPPHGTCYSIDYNVRRIQPRPHKQQSWTRENYHSGRPTPPMLNIQLLQPEDQPFSQTAHTVLARDIALCHHKALQFLIIDNSFHRFCIISIHQQLKH